VHDKATQRTPINGSALDQPGKGWRSWLRVLAVDRIVDQRSCGRNLRRDALPVEFVRIEPCNEHGRTELVASEMDRNPGRTVQAIATGENDRGGG
jgi:hypothetical protein